MIRWQHFTILTAVVSVSILLAPEIFGQETTMEDLRKEINTLKEVVNQQEKQIKELEGGQD